MPLVAIIGRPNVGKSTLFNRLAGSRKALVDNTPGVTRDLHYADVRFDGRAFTLVDTGGLAIKSDEELKNEIRVQVMFALEIADAVILLMDGRDGLTPDDLDVADILRRKDIPTHLVVNKIDGPVHEPLVAEFFSLGVDNIHAISAREKIGVHELFREVTQDFPKESPEQGEASGAEELDEQAQKPLRIAIVGRPNVGKSSLVNRILGEPRMIVSSIPGTTMDAIDTPCIIDGRPCVLVDTAGIRRKARVHSRIETYGVVKALQALVRSDVACLLIDANERLADQDLRIASYALDRGCGLIFVLNKTDLADSPAQALKRFEEYADFKITHMNYVPRVHISAKTGKGVSKLFDSLQTVAAAVNLRVPTGELNRLVEKAAEKHAPVDKRGRPFNLLYATQVRVRPPTFVVFTNAAARPHFSYERYLVNTFRKIYGFPGSPVRVFFRRRKKDKKKPI